MENSHIVKTSPQFNVTNKRTLEDLYRENNASDQDKASSLFQVNQVLSKLQKKDFSLPPETIKRICLQFINAHQENLNSILPQTQKKFYRASHPDKNKGNEKKAEKFFKIIQNCFEHRKNHEAKFIQFVERKIEQNKAIAKNNEISDRFKDIISPKTIKACVAYHSGFKITEAIMKQGVKVIFYTMNNNTTKENIVLLLKNDILASLELLTEIVRTDEDYETIEEMRAEISGNNKV